MVVGIKKITGRITLGDEYGLYRQTEEKHDYLMFVTTTYRDLVKHGRFLAKYFGVKFENYVPEPEKPEPEDGEEILKEKPIAKEERSDLGIISDFILGKEDSKPNPELMNALNTILPENSDFKRDPYLEGIMNRDKPRRVSGVAKKVKPLIAEGKTDEEIFQIMLPDYQNVGRNEKQARELLLPYLKDIRAGKI